MDYNKGSNSNSIKNNVGRYSDIIQETELPWPIQLKLLTKMYSDHQKSLYEFVYSTEFVHI